MDSLRFFLPTTIESGAECVRSAAARWALGRKALLVTGRGAAAASGALADAQAALEARGAGWAHFDGIRANPDADQVYAGVAMAREQGCDFVVGIGGGSALDAAKAIAWAAATGVPQERFFRMRPEPGDAVLPIVAIPTTCGTGSEVTPYAIVTNHEAKTKVNVSGEGLFPKVALLDARYLKSLPPQVLCDTALDALSHAIEGAYSPRSTRLTEALAAEAIRTIVPELVRMAHGAFVNQVQLQYAATVAGVVIAQTGTGLVHAMGYPLTYHKGIPHGRANGILLAGYLDFMARPCAALTEKLLEAASLRSTDELHGLVDALLDVTNATPEAPSEDELMRFTREPLRLDLVRRYRTMPSPEEVMDIYRTGF